MVYISRTPREPRRLSNEWDWSCCSSGKPTPSNCGKPLSDCAERVFYFRIYYDRGRVAGRIHPTCFADRPSRTALDLVLLKRESFYLCTFLQFISDIGAGTKWFAVATQTSTAVAYDKFKFCARRAFYPFAGHRRNIVPNT
jgi:hypothetical protein